MELSWKLTSNTDEQNTLFKDSGSVYDIDVFLCSCGHYEFITRNKIDEIEYCCRECGNNHFYNANEALASINFFLSNIKNINDFLTMRIEKTNEEVSVVCYFRLPYQFNFLREIIKQKKLYVYKLSISDEGKISKEYLNTPSLELSQEMTKKLYPYITENRKLTQFDLLSKKTFEKINNEFRVNFNLIDFELLSWDNNEFGERHLSGALEYILNKRREKSVKKALYKSYGDIVKSKNSFNPIYTFVFTKHVKDPNILSRLLDLKLQNSLEIYDDEYTERKLDSGFEAFILFLKKHYSETNIYNILKNKRDTGDYLTDTIQEVLFYEESNLDTFVKTKSNIRSIHNMLVQVNSRQRYNEMYEMKFQYTKEVKQKCIKLDNYDVILPQNGEELFRYAEQLQNCMAGYAQSIKHNWTAIYIFYKNDEIQFAAEVCENTLIQASTKYNGLLDLEDQLVLKIWMKKFNIKNENQDMCEYNQN